MLLARLESPAAQLAGLIYQLMRAEHDDRSATVAFGREIMRFASDEVMSDVRRMRDAKLMQIGGGTSEIQQHIIARALLKAPAATRH